MTLTLKDINSAATGASNFSHFSKISILPGTFKVVEHTSQGLLLGQRFRKNQDKSSDPQVDYSFPETCDRREKGENRLLTQLLSTDADSVLEYSIASDRAHRDSDFQLFTPPLFEGNYSLTLDELNAQIALLLAESFPHNTTNFLSELALTYITQVVQLNQIFARLESTESSDKSVTVFVQLCNKIMRDVWLRSLTSSIDHMHTVLQILDRFDGQYSKLEVRKVCDHEIETIVRRWSLLNYFPPVVISSLNCEIEAIPGRKISKEERNMISKSELFRRSFITLAIESSKGFSKMLNILIDLDAYESFSHHTVLNFLELLLTCTVDTGVGDIMIGLEQTVKRWITAKDPTEPLTKTMFHQWAQKMMTNYKIQQEHEIMRNGTQDEADLMFDKWEVARLFVGEILQFVQPEPTSQARSDTPGWLTVFDDYYDATPSNEEPTDFHVDSISIKSIQRPATKLNHRGQSKRDAIKKWATRSKSKVTQSCHRFKRRIQRVFHMHTNHALITSVRYYNALSGKKNDNHYPEQTPSFASDQCAQVQRLTQKLYKSEQRGKRKRDALRVIFM